MSQSEFPQVTSRVTFRVTSRASSAKHVLTALGIVTAVAMSSLALTAICAPAMAQQAANEQMGVSTGLPVPRYVSLKATTTNIRRGPAKEHGAVWTYTKAGLPVEITGEFENWRKVRDWEGSEGWVFHTLLSGRRTVMIAPWKKEGLLTLHKEAQADSPAVAKIGPRVVAKVRACNKDWCRISGSGFDGYITQKALWGVYPNENVK